MNLKNEFYNCLNVLGVPNREINKEWDYLMECYVDNRVYHGILHIKKVIELINENDINLIEPLLVKVAGFYHDICYVPGDTKNEYNSIVILQNRLGQYLSVGDMITIEDLIIETTDGVNPTTSDGKILKDIDLISGLCENYDEFKLNNDRIINEFSKVYPNDLVISGRKDFLNKLLLKENIFHSEFFTTFDPSIKENIKKYINSI